MDGAHPRTIALLPSAARLFSHIHCTPTAVLSCQGRTFPVDHFFLEVRRGGCSTACPLDLSRSVSPITLCVTHHTRYGECMSLQDVYRDTRYLLDPDSPVAIRSNARQRAAAIIKQSAGGDRCVQRCLCTDRSLQSEHTCACVCGGEGIAVWAERCRHRHAALYLIAVCQQVQPMLRQSFAFPCTILQRWRAFGPRGGITVG